MLVAFSSWRGDPPPQKLLELANAHLESARKTKDSELALMFCDDAESALSRVKRAVKKTEDQSLRERTGVAYFELGKLFANLGHQDKAQENYKKAEKWG